MRLTEFFVLSAVSLLTGAIFWWLPRMRRGGLYFGVTVPGEFRSSPTGRAIARDFRLAVYASTLVTWALEFLAVQGQPSIVSGLAPMVQVVASLVAWVWAWSRTRPHAAPPDLRRDAALEDEEPAALWLVAAAAPLLAMLASACYLASVFDALPDRYPIHWNAAGEADRYSDKSFSSVFFGSVMGSGVILMMVVNVWMLVRHARRGPGGRRGFTNRYLHANLRMITILSWGLGLLFAVISLVPVFPKDSTSLLFLGVLLLPLALIAITLLPMMKLAEECESEPDQTPDDRWLLGMVYWNSQDPALVVPKRSGVGYSLNFAQPRAWLFFALMMSFVLGPLVLIRNL